MIVEGPELGYHQNWYAICKSSELKTGSIVGRDFLDNKVIAYRGANGKAQVLSAYCSHIGADLSIGDVVGNEVRCPFHHWQYNQDGICTKIPAGCKIPERARQRAFPTAEKWGLVWAFNGETPLFDVPGVRGYEEDEILYRVKEYEGGFPVSPWVLICNSHDYQHLRSLHDLEIKDGPSNMVSKDYVLEHDVSYVMPGGVPVLNWNRVTGTNTFSAISKTPTAPFFGMWTGTRTHGEFTRGYMLAGVPKKIAEERGEGSVLDYISMAGRMVTSLVKDAERLFRASKFMIGFLKDDEDVLKTIKFRQGVMVEADQVLLMYLKYVREFPKANMLAGY